MGKLSLILLLSTHGILGEDELGGKVKITRSDHNHSLLCSIYYYIIMQGQCVTSCYDPLTETRFTPDNFNPWLYGTVAFTMAAI